MNKIFSYFFIAALLFLNTIINGSYAHYNSLSRIGNRLLITHSKIDDKEIALIKNKLVEKKFTKVTDLHVFNCSFIENHVFKSFAQLMSNNASLTKLEMNIADIHSDNSRHLQSLLANNSSLTHLDLSHNNLKSEGCTHIAQMLEKNSTITYLNLSCNSICSIGAHALGQMLSVNTTLKRLELYGNKIDNFESILCEGIALNTTLTELNLNECSLSSGEKIGNVLKANCGLTRLNLADNKYNENDVNLIFDSLTTNTTLTHLQLYNFEHTFTQSNILAIIALFKTNNSLKHLVLWLDQQTFDYLQPLFKIKK